MSSPQPLAAFTDALLPSGLNLVGVASTRAWNASMGPQRTTEALFPAARSILVVGNGGPTMWRAFVRDLDADPRHLTEEANPLDAFARRTILGADTALGPAARRWFWAAADADTHVDFRVLANLAGFGRASRLGLLLHDTFGPWVGLRAACFIDADLPGTHEPETSLAAEPTLARQCLGCSACVAACPGSAFPGDRWAVDVCSTYHHLSTRCASTCHARDACPVGADQRYDEAEITYHSNRALGRQALRERLGLAQGADRFEGIGPHWTDWRTRVGVVRG